MALLIGGAAFAAAVFPEVRAVAARPAHRLDGVDRVTAATVLGLLLYGPYAEGLGFGDIFSTTLIGDTLGLRFGQIWLARFALLLVVAPLLVLLFRRDGDGRRRARCRAGGRRSRHRSRCSSRRRPAWRVTR